MKKLIQKHVHLDAERNRQFLNQRGHMLAFLFFAFAGSLMINNFAEPINQANAAYIEQVAQ
jgi:hypothetical protein